MPEPQQSGVLALQGGGPFERNDELDRALLAEGSTDHVVMLPTADAFEQPKVLVETATAWASRMGVTLEPLMVLTRDEADESAAAVVASASTVFLAGDSASHLRSVLKDTPLFVALTGVLDRGGTVIACGPCAAAMCDPMTDLRGGGFALGLGVAQGVAVVPASETWPREQLERAHALANTALVDLPTGSALIRRGSDWELVGEATVRGSLPG